MRSETKRGEARWSKARPGEVRQGQAEWDKLRRSQTSGQRFQIIWGKADSETFLTHNTIRLITSANGGWEWSRSLDRPFRPPPSGRASFPENGPERAAPAPSRRAAHSGKEFSGAFLFCMTGRSMIANWRCGVLVLTHDWRARASERSSLFIIIPFFACGHVWQLASQYSTAPRKGPPSFYYSRLIPFALLCLGHCYKRPELPKPQLKLSRLTVLKRSKCAHLLAATNFFHKHKRCPFIGIRGYQPIKLHRQSIFRLSDIALSIFLVST